MWRHTMTNNTVHFISNIMGYYITRAETAIAANAPAQHSSLEDVVHKSVFMDQSFAGPNVLRRNLRVLNQKEDRDLQQKLVTLDKQYRYTRKMLQERRDSLMKEQGRVVRVRVCEPKATLNIAMKEIGEHKNTETHFRGVQTSDGRRLYSRKSQFLDCESEPSRSISAPPPASVRRRGNIQSSVSLLQMKRIATIDSISEKELARQQQKAREEMERLRQFQGETLHKRVVAFIQKLQDKSNMQVHLEPP